MKKEVIALRHTLHKYPEVSNKEFETAKRISNFIKAFNPDHILDLGTTGKAFVFDGKESGKTLIFRAELDALPIHENSKVNHSSVNHNVSHSCGHDGHMAIVAGLAYLIAEKRPQKGKVVLLFQAAEEVGQGAKDVINDPNFKDIEPDYIFALHNIPGIESNKILLKKDTFAAASKGMTVELKGKTSHAAEPNEGVSPTNAISRIINALQVLNIKKYLFKEFVLITIIHVSVGERSFGTTPGFAEILITLRAFDNNDMDNLTKETAEIILNIASDEELEHFITYSEVFPSIINDNMCVSLIEGAARDNDYAFTYLNSPFKWSEDFGFYSEKYKSGFFGLGSGKNQPTLHSSNYDFPDRLIETGINMFFNMYKKINF